MEFGDYRFEHFLHGHKAQLDAGGIPPELWGSLYSKLMQQTFDAGKYFRILCEETDDGRNWSVYATRDLHPVDENNVFLVDHAWTFRPQQARAQLDELPQLVERMKSLLDIDMENCPCAESDNDNDDEVTTNEEECFKFEQKQLEVSASSSGSLPRPESIDARLCNTVKEDSSIVDQILRKMWQYIQTYTVRFKEEIDEEGMPLWYIMDEFGVRISHSDTPNVKVVPLYFIPHNAAYSVVFPVKEIADGEEICRDYADHTLARRQPEWRNFLMVPWLDDDEIVLKEDYPRQHPDENFFMSGRTLDMVPSESDQQHAAEAIRNRNLAHPLRIYADGLQIIENLHAVKYEEVSDWRSADVIWLKRHFHEYDKLCTDNPSSLVNQFPNEACLTVKDLLSAILMDQNSGEGLPWYQTCFNLNIELPQFIAHYLHRKSRSAEVIQSREAAQSVAFIIKTYGTRTSSTLAPSTLVKQLKETCEANVLQLSTKQSNVPSLDEYSAGVTNASGGLDNTWIIKPWNLARGMDMFVSDDLRQIVRLTESGPKVACKYVERPVLFHREDSNSFVKFDLRYIVFVTQVRPIQAYVYNNFWIRFAINEFSLDRLDDIGTHFTVFNYSDSEKVLQMRCSDFIERFEKTYPSIKWSTIQKQINRVLRSALDAACRWDPPRGLAKNAQSRAMYGADLMLKWQDDEEKEVQATLLEFNFMPDCERACNSYPDFADTVFQTLFLDEIDRKKLTEI